MMLWADGHASARVQTETSASVRNKLKVDENVICSPCRVQIASGCTLQSAWTSM